MDCRLEMVQFTINDPYYSTLLEITQEISINLRDEIILARFRLSSRGQRDEVKTVVPRGVVASAFPVATESEAGPLQPARVSARGSLLVWNEGARKRD